VVISLQPWLPVAEWQALGLSAEKAKGPEVARTARATTLPAAPAKPGKGEAAKPRRRGLLGWLRRLFGR
jgi:hypothetical protein